jgi:glycosyl transferase family 25
MNNIDKIFIVNLDKDIERLNNSYKQLNKYNITNYERYPAVNGKDLNQKELNSYTTILGKIIASKSMIGCGISHINIWRKIIKEKINRCLILEDDFILVDDFLNKYNTIIDKVPYYNYNMLFLSSTQAYYNFYKIRDINNHFYKPLFVCQTVGYIITLKGAQNILKNIDKVFYHIDIQISLQSLITDLNIIAVKEPLIYQTFESSHNTNDRKYPLLIDNLLNNNHDVNYYYKISLFSIAGLDINYNIIVIFLLGFYIFPYAFILLILEYLYKLNDLFLDNLAILVFGYIIRLIYLSLIDLKNK